MAIKDSVLLIIKQNQGIEYNELANKISENYKNTNTAKAALSRTIKDLSAFGLLIKKKNHVFITEKGEIEASKQMKGKLLLKINTAFNKPDFYFSANLKEIDELITLTHALQERSKQDKDLLAAAKSSATFTIDSYSELLQQSKDHRKKLLLYEKILKKQIEQFKQLDFNDYYYGPVEIEKILKILNKQREILIETKYYVPDAILEQVQGKKNLNNYVIKKPVIFIEWAQTNNYDITIINQNSKIIIQNKTMFVYANYKLLRKIK